MLGHVGSQLVINPINFVIQKHMNERFVLDVVVYDEVEDTIEIDEYHQKWNSEMPKNPIPLLLCQIGGSLT